MSVAIPKIKMTVLAKGIPKKLENMGMKKLFTPSADFTGISHIRPLFVSDVIHKAFVDIDEVGTEAAAATVVLLSRSLPQSIHKDFTVDHPYLFLIRDSITGSILFLGRVVLPES
jgi:serpin B